MSLISQLHRAELDCLYRVSEILSRSLDCAQTVGQVLDVLDEEVGLSRGMVSVVEPESGDLVVHAVHGMDAAEPVRYQPGEGILGVLLEDKRSIALPVAGRDARFLNRMGIYDRTLPFIAAPINVGGSFKGVLAVQPDEPDDGLLNERARFVEMVASLIGRSVRLALDVAAEKKSIAEERDSLRRTVRHQYGFDNIVGHSAVMRRIFEQIRMVAKWNTTVLIRGETGTGKELIANAIHYNSPRARGAYVRINCASLPETLLESELFGHEKGAFTGAVGARKGRFEMADGGTLFLDEIGEISPAFQAKLLRVLQEGEFERVGGSRSLKVDVRVIAATHRNLEAAVDAGDFREDLYYRLNVMPILLPPLRERVEDIPEIARHLVGRLGKAQGRPLAIGDSAIRRLTQYGWPGTVREMENCLERAAVMSTSGTIEGEQIKTDRGRGRVREREGDREGGVPPRLTLAEAGADDEAAASPTPRSTDLGDPELDERSKVIAALQQAGWVQAKAARLLGMTPRQIAYRIQILNIEVKQF
jgi:Nif-specific regulatory protein